MPGGKAATWESGSAPALAIHGPTLPRCGTSMVRAHAPAARFDLSASELRPSLRKGPEPWLRRLSSRSKKREVSADQKDVENADQTSVSKTTTPHASLQ